MPFHSEVMAGEGLIHTVMSGPVSQEELWSLLDVRLAADVEAGVCRHLIDARAITGPPPSPHVLQSLASRSARLFGRRGRLREFRTAIIASDDTVFAAARAYEFQAACEGLMVRAFRDPLEARLWLTLASAAPATR